MLNTEFRVDYNIKLTCFLQDILEPVGGSKNFMAFGGGLRLCVGADFAKLQMAIFLHCLVIKYRYCVCV
jgi:cytochrome P450